MRDYIDKLVFCGTDALRQGSFDLPQRHPGLLFGLRFDELADGFRLDQIHLPVRDRSKRKLAGCCDPGPGGPRRFDDPRQDYGIPMGADFEDVFAGIRMRSAEESNHDLVDFFTTTIEPPSNDSFPMMEFTRFGMGLKESPANGKHLRSRHSEDSKSAVPQR